MLRFVDEVEWFSIQLLYTELTDMENYDCLYLSVLVFESPHFTLMNLIFQKPSTEEVLLSSLSNRPVY